MMAEPSMPVATRAVRPRSLAPKEHGAYGQLALPLVAGLAMGRPGVAAFALAAGSALAFVAHEPLLILAGQRGARARREEGDRARRRVAALGAGALAAGSVGLAFAPPAARLATIVPLALVALLVPFIARNAEKTTAGELLAAAALASTGVPVALAAGVAPGPAWGAWIAFWLAFGSSTFAVRAVIAHVRAPVSWTRRAAAPAILAVVALVLARAGVLAPSAAMGAAPMLALALALALRPPPPTALRRVGWRLVATSLILCAALAAGAHL